jgi:hypothetical protein
VEVASGPVAEPVAELDAELVAELDAELVAELEERAEIRQPEELEVLLVVVHYWDSLES